MILVIGCHKSLVSLNSVIAGYEENENFIGAVKLFAQMQLKGEKPDRHTLSSVLGVCTGLVDLLVTKTVMTYCRFANKQCPYNYVFTMWCDRGGATNF
ncbi:putative pentatricopeptide [Rosa chinensis]|uniref:Putative pentatricopeptide n=1 Tax=Rosa chinensis TaxID=74649 RepID=A0A2P6PMZ9_ROSCH|nr:putative pentatricopeptide [Rosa chinensis]